MRTRNLTKCCKSYYELPLSKANLNNLAKTNPDHKIMGPTVSIAAFRMYLVKHCNHPVSHSVRELLYHASFSNVSHSVESIKLTYNDSKLNKYDEKKINHYDTLR